MKFQYWNGESYSLCSVDPAKYYSLGRLDDELFYRRPTKNLEQSKIVADFLLKNRIKQLRRKYGYIRLWFSGGKDSTLALNSAIRHNVHIDEIVVIRRTCKNGPDLYPDYAQIHEIDHAINYLNSVKSSIPNTKISIVELDDPQHESIFEDPNWYRYTTEWFFNIGYSMNMFYRYVNRQFKILDDVENRCDLCGAAVPQVFYDNSIKQWSFNFIDAVFVTAHGGLSNNTVFEDFLIAEDSPQLLNFFVNTIIDDIELKYHSTGIFDVEHCVSPGEYQRITRDRSTLYNTEIIGNYNRFQFKKEIGTIQFPSDDYFWQIDPAPKGFNDIINRWSQNPIPRCLQLYINSPWDQIKIAQENRRYTKTWNLK